MTCLQRARAAQAGAPVFGEAVDPFVLPGGAGNVGATRHITRHEVAVLRHPATPAVEAIEL